MKFASWNINGLRARLKKDFMPAFKNLNADVLAVQEIKMQAGEATLELNGYKQFWNHGERKGYAGTAIFSRVEPKNFSCGIGVDEFDSEGRVITLNFQRHDDKKKRAKNFSRSQFFYAFFVIIHDKSAT